MISSKLQIVMLLGIVGYFVILFILLKKNRLLLKYTLLWFFSGIIMLVMTIFPGILTWVANLVGVYAPVNALFALFFFCGIMLMVALTSIVSSQNERIKRLVQQVAILDEEIREMKEK